GGPLLGFLVAGGIVAAREDLALLADLHLDLGGQRRRHVPLHQRAVGTFVARGAVQRFDAELHPGFGMGQLLGHLARAAAGGQEREDGSGGQDTAKACMHLCRQWSCGRYQYHAPPDARWASSRATAIIPGHERLIAAAAAAYDPE